MRSGSELQSTASKSRWRRWVRYASVSAISFVLGSVTVFGLDLFSASGTSITVFGLTIYERHEDNRETIVQIFPPARDPEPIRAAPTPPSAKKPTKSKPKAPQKPQRKQASPTAKLVNRAAPPSPPTYTKVEPALDYVAVKEPEVWELAEEESISVHERTSSSVSVESPEGGAAASAEGSASIEVTGDAVVVSGTTSVQSYSSVSTTTIVNGVARTVTVSSGDSSLLDEPWP